MEAERSKAGEKRDGKSQDASTDSAKQSGDPGRTPGSAEGDEQTVDESLRQKEGGVK
ncbi:MAG TPA: hypothetical protein VM866_04185 [Pyrinomonadaceae bacterium]|jgi:hypothetical protein|nr:hypothetical protein [Pyrinomonadaceae bacterium]